MRIIPATLSNQKKVVGYCRVSTTRGSQEESLELQKNGLEKIVRENPDWTLFRVYTDAESGKDRDSDLIRALSASIAQAESESLSESIKWGLKRGFELEHQSFMLENVLGINTAKKPS